MSRVTSSTLREMSAAMMLLLLPACAAHDRPTSTILTGPDLGAVEALASRARRGDQEAQFALGQRYELGLGVAMDLPRAIASYRRAAEDKGGDRWIYLPSTSAGVRAQLIRVSKPKRDGLPAAKARLRELAVQQ